MKKLKMQQIDVRYVLVDKYKSLGLSEIDLATLLVIYNILSEQSILITSDLLALKMNMDFKALDEELVSLINRNFIEYENVDNIMKTSLKPTIQKVVDALNNEIFDQKLMELDENAEQVVSNLFMKFEKEFGRSLSSIELDKIREWLSMNLDEEMIIDSLREAKAKSNKVTIRMVDKIILKRMTHQDREKEGYSSLDDKYKKDIERTIEIASYDWLNDDK